VFPTSSAYPPILPLAHASARVTPAVGYPRRMSDKPAARVRKVRDERLCWLAVRDELARRSRRGALWFVLTLATGTLGMFGGGHAAETRRGWASSRLAGYAFAVDAAASKLTAEERRVLRATGQVPRWFLAEVDRLHKAERRGDRQ
jgi:hypothetical protein